MEDYYRSPKWAEKRTERLKLDGFRCAKCGFTRALEVHHINYERFGNEDVSRDLITLCKKCHNEIENQKQKINPIVDPKEHHSVYLAGKIRANGWRELICGYRCGLDLDIDNPYEELEVNINLTITGPFFISCDHGCYHGDESHGVGAERIINGERCDGCLGNFFTKNEVFNICKSQIDKSEIVFAYIDCLDCFGTLAEIGYAHAKEKTIIIQFSSDMLKETMWFIDKMQQRTCKVSDEWIEKQLLSKLKEELEK